MVKYGFSDPYFPVYGDSVQIRENTDRILHKYGKIRIRESPYFGIFHTVGEQELYAN